MITRWMIAKYVGDPARNEPRNIGVLLLHDRAVFAKFVGTSPDGVVDGRVLRGRLQSLDNYKAWVKHWRKESQKISTPEQFDELRKRLPGAPYYLEPGGSVAVTTEVEPETLLDQLYARIVRSREKAERQPSIIDEAFRSLGLFDRIERDVFVEAGASRMPVDYKYTNGKENFMADVTVGGHDDKKTWKQVNLAVRVAEVVDRYKAETGREARAIALVTEVPEVDTREQFELLKSFGMGVVKVKSVTATSSALGKELGVGGVRL